MFAPRIAIFAIFSLAAGLASAQSITSAHSGTIHYMEGDVSLDGQTLTPKPARFDEMREAQVLRTGRGRAEVLLTPGVFLRIAENSAVRMLDNRLASTRLEFLEGSAMVETEDPKVSVTNAPVTIIHNGFELRLAKQGLVEINSDPAEVRVYKGQAEVSSSTDRIKVLEGKLAPLTPVLTTEKFDPKTGDDLYLWSRDRSESLSAASMASARYLSDSRSTPWQGGWFLNPYMGMYTYVPMTGMMSSPFGFGFYSPMAIFNIYSPSYSFYPGTAPRATASLGTTSLTSPLRQAGGFGSAPQLGSPLRSGASAPTSLRVGAARAHR